MIPKGSILIPEQLFPVALAYYQCGAYLSFILYSYTTISITWRDYTFIWALCFAILGALAAALILSFCKAVSKRIVWIHLYLFSIGSALLLASGLILLLNNAGKYIVIYRELYEHLVLISSIITDRESFGGFIAIE